MTEPRARPGAQWTFTAVLPGRPHFHVAHAGLVIFQAGSSFLHEVAVRW